MTTAPVSSLASTMSATRSAMPSCLGHDVQALLDKLAKATLASTAIVDAKMALRTQRDVDDPGMRRLPATGTHDLRAGLALRVTRAIAPTHRNLLP